MQSRKKVWLLLTAALVALILISACSGNESEEASNVSSPGTDTPAPATNSSSSEPEVQESTKVSEKPITFKWLMSERRDAPINNDWEILNRIFEATNVRVQFEAVPENGYDEKARIMLATNSITDFMPISHADGRRYGPEGLFLNLNDYAHLTPNINKHYEENPLAKAVVTASDGGMYTIQSLNDPRFKYSYVWIVRSDIMEELGLQHPTNPDELYEILKVMKQHYPDSYPLIPERNEFNGPATLFTAVQRMFTGLEGYIAFDPFQQKYAFAPEREGFREALEYMNKLYVEQLLDPEFAIITPSQWDERMLSGKSFVTYYWRTRLARLNDNAAKAGLIDGYHVDAMPLFAKEGIEPYQFGSNIYQPAGVAISNNVEDKEAAVKFLDYLLGEEGSNYTALGIEGVTYEIVDGEPKLKEDMQDTVMLRAEFGVGYGSFNPFNDKLANAREGKTEDELRVDDMYLPHVIEQSPPLLYTDEENERVAEILSNLDVYIDQKVAEFIAGRVPINDQTIQEFLNATLNFGANEVVEINNTAYQRHYGN